MRGCISARLCVARLGPSDPLPAVVGAALMQTPTLKLLPTGPGRRGDATSCAWCSADANPCLETSACRYRAAEEMKAWRARDPVTRFQLWLVQQGWWSDEQDKEARAAARRWGWVGGG